MVKIKQMDSALANQIAAGEVVERPASVVKELVENAIDAQATIITIELIEAGIQSIKVIDNGIGMVPEDLKTAILPHATSKIYTVHDLFRIQSLGFRGEALASIGSVSKLTLESTTEDAEEGYQIRVQDSAIVEETISKPRQGTTIIVEDLFYNTPARLKHLKTLQTELKHTVTFVQNIALAYPNIRFTLIHNDQRIFNSTGNGNLQQTIANVYSASIARQLIPISGESMDFNLSGYISPPQLTRTNKQYIHWMINQRPIRSMMLDKVLLRAYGKQLMIGRYPLSVINIEIDPYLVDVNVHPTKQTVRLSKEDELSQLLSETLKEQLSRINPVPEVSLSDIEPQKNQKTSATTIPFEFNYQKTIDHNNSTIDKRALKEALDDDPRDSKNHSNKDFQPDKRSKVLEASENYVRENQREIDDNETIDFLALRYVGQIHGTYLIAESEDGFFLIDQHAAQERIRYEALLEEEINVTTQQQLLLPLILEFSASEMLAIDSIQPQLQRVGVFLTQFSPTSYQLDHYPNWIDANDVEKVVRELVELIIEQPDLSLTDYLEAGIIMHSCRGAIKANHYLDKKQAEALINDMANLEDPYHCPHGRPVFVEFGEKSIEKMFKRIQDTHQTTFYN